MVSEDRKKPSLVGLVDWILLRCSDWTMIPLENIISASRGTGTRIAAAVSSSDDITGAGFALEHGVDAVLIPPKIDLLNYSLTISNQVASKERTPDQVQSVCSTPRSLTSLQLESAIECASTLLILLNWGKASW